MSDHDWARVCAIRAALDAGQPIDPADAYWLGDSCAPPPAPRVFEMTPQLRLWLWSVRDSIMEPATA